MFETEIQYFFDKGIGRILREQLKQRHEVYLIGIARIHQDLVFSKLDWQGVGLVGLELHLVGIPVGTHERKVTNANICALAFDFLQVPKREGIVVSVGEENTVFTTRFKVVMSEVACAGFAAAVVVVPVLNAHEHRNN